ncbi:hypothetical protein B0H14DRAFT_2595577 [Mycena olivaceomarginata]|nr:hypothetical protein B0H14DRAFT_2595577 [Mycena olivaceomarginata]
MSMGAGPSHPPLTNNTLPSVTQMTPPVNTDLQTSDHLQPTAVPFGIIVPDAHAPAATALGKRCQQEYAIDPQARAGPFFPSQASTSGNVQNHPVEGGAGS